jgi:hypothetical protein
MKKLNLLIVEDDTEVTIGYESSIRAFNKTNDRGIEIKPIIVSDKDKAIEILRNSDNIFDGAIIDLDLKQTGGEDASGNEVIREIKNNLRFPVYIISGTAHNIDSELNHQSSFFKVKNRDEDFDFIEEITSVFDTGITGILNRKGTVENYINEIFWNHMSNSMDLWIKDKTRSPQEKEKSLLRYTLLHMQEHIDEELEKYHPSEFYITKPIKKNIFTGDIIEFDKSRYIILTPSCDIVLRASGERSAQYILLCKIKSLDQVVKNYDKLTSETAEKSDDRKRIVGFFQNNNQRYHFIPKAELIEAGLIDFQDKLTIPNNKINSLLETKNIERIATISQPFLKDIISRYSNYYSRQGSPDFNVEELYSSIFNV